MKRNEKTSEKKLIVVREILKNAENKKIPRGGGRGCKFLKSQLCRIGKYIL